MWKNEVNWKYFSTFVIAKRDKRLPVPDSFRYGVCMLLLISSLRIITHIIYIIDQDEEDNCNPVHVCRNRHDNECGSGPQC